MRTALFFICFFLGVITIWLSRYFGEELINGKLLIIEIIIILALTCVCAMLFADWGKNK